MALAALRPATSANEACAQDYAARSRDSTTCVSASRVARIDPQPHRIITIIAKRSQIRQSLHLMSSSRTDTVQSINSATIATAAAFPRRPGVPSLRRRRTITTNRQAMETFDASSLGAFSVRDPISITHSELGGYLEGVDGPQWLRAN